MNVTQLISVSFTLLITGCAVGPNYQRPATFKSQPVPNSFGQAYTNAASASRSSTNVVQWKLATPSADQRRGTWWEAFGDPELIRLERLGQIDNQSITAALARFEQARALVKVARANFFPQINLNPSLVRERTSANAPTQGQPAGQAYVYNTYDFSADLSWEVDLWGRIRRQTEAAKARLTATADDVESLRLATEAEIASDYFVLRALEAEGGLLADTIQTYRRSLELTQNRRKGGIATDLDVSEAETQLRSAEAQVPVIDLQRQNLLHALATLCGQPAPDFQVGPANTERAVPLLPPGLPSELLERRPDIAAAERRMAAANADIGVATGAFYPRIVFNGLAGFQSLNAGALFDWPSRLWAIGPSLELPLFTGGRNRAQLSVAQKAYNEAVANYRQTVLTAFQEVEDQLAAEHFLAAQLQAQGAALTSARHTLEIASNRYKAGLVTYLEVATAQSAALNQERTVVQLEGQQRVALISLIRALGGQWEKSG